MLNIKNISVSSQNKKILNGLTLNVEKGEIHAIMGQNGSGKTTLAKILTGHPEYKLTKGSIFFENINISFFDPTDRAKLGIFLAFQYPVEIPGVSNEEFLRIAFNLKRKNKNLLPLTNIEFFTAITNNLKNINPLFLQRNVNEGFSGGEKKINEILQMEILNPKLLILDEIDSGLDIDTMRLLSNKINKFMNSTKALILITHYQRLLKYIKPDFIHIIDTGKIIKTDDYTLAETLESKGYGWIKNRNISE